jgi:hypothetical protein
MKTSTTQVRPANARAQRRPPSSRTAFLPLLPARRSVAASAARGMLPGACTRVCTLLPARVHPNQASPSSVGVVPVCTGCPS